MIRLKIYRVGSTVSEKHCSIRNPKLFRIGNSSHNPQHITTATHHDSSTLPHPSLFVKMRYIHSEETLNIPEGVKVGIKTRNVTVEGPRGAQTLLYSMLVGTRPIENQHSHGFSLIKLWRTGLFKNKSAN
jgi:hypothetical protein